MSFKTCQGSETDLALAITLICEEPPHTKVQLTVPLREITQKKPLFFLPLLMRVHEHAFTFGSSTSTFFQLHIVNCTGLGEEKVKASVATLRLERCKSADGQRPQWKQAFALWIQKWPALFAFCFCILTSRLLALVLDCSWSLAITYIRYSMTCRTLSYYLLGTSLSREWLRRDTVWFGALFCTSKVAVTLLLLKWQVPWIPSNWQKWILKELSWPSAFPKLLYYIYLHCLVNNIFP